MTDDTRLQPEGVIWRWPNRIAMSPSSLKTFSQCAFRNKLRYLQSIDPPDVWVRHFALGNATHSALGTIAQQMKVGAPLIGEEQVRTLCAFHMPDHEYPSPEAREADVKLVLRWVDRGTRYLQALKVEEWLLTERSQRREVPLFPAQAPYTLLSKPDLVVRRTDTDGESLIHIIDWKTGQRRQDLEHDVPVIMRYVLRDSLAQWVGNASAATVRFTWVWLEDGGRDHVEATVEHCNHRWPDILGQMEAMATETEWKATPGWYCNYCPYYRNHCPEEIPPDTEW